MGSGKGCAWAAMYSEGRCRKKYNGVTGYDACPCSCGGGEDSDAEEGEDTSEDADRDWRLCLMDHGRRQGLRLGGRD